MSPVTFDQFIALASCIVAVVSLVVGFARSSKAAHMSDQRTQDKLDSIGSIVGDTRDTVRELDRKIDDHGQRLAKAESDISGIQHRLDRIEERCDRHFGSKEE